MSPSRRKQLPLGPVATLSEERKLGKAFSAATNARVSLRSRALDETRREFWQLDSLAARTIFADHWLGLQGAALEDTWPMVYEVLAHVQKYELYKKPTQNRSQTYETFEEYFRHYFGKSFDRWTELEQTYQFARKFAPDLFQDTYSEAKAKLRDNGGDRKSENYQISATKPISRVPGREYWLARMERDAPNNPAVAAQLEAVQAGDSTANAAAIRLGWRSKKHCRTCQCSVEV